MVTTQGQRQLTVLRMRSNSLRDGLTYFGHLTRILEYTNGRVILGGDLFELVVSVESD